MSKPNLNEGIIVNGGTINAGNLAVGPRAKAISIGTREPAYAPPPEPVATRSVEETDSSGRRALEDCEWDAFISHASEDKPFVAPLARALQRRGLRIWYDDVSLGVGNSLRESIDFGLIRSRYGIVVFSRHYFSKDWTRQEVNGLLSREVGGVRVVLPIWHNVSPADVLRFSPILADRVAARSSEDLETVVAKLERAIRTPQEPKRHV
jgi:hypothetical protein